jgi:hypothetical protein
MTPGDRLSGRPMLLAGSVCFAVLTYPLLLLVQGIAPIRSSSGPKTRPPSGRRKNAAAKIASMFSNAAVSSPAGKTFAG